MFHRADVLRYCLKGLTGLKGLGLLGFALAAAVLLVVSDVPVHGCPRGVHGVRCRQQHRELQLRCAPRQARQVVELLAGSDARRRSPHRVRVTGERHRQPAGEQPTNSPFESPGSG